MLAILVAAVYLRWDVLCLCLLLRAVWFWFYVGWVAGSLGLVGFAVLTGLVTGGFGVLVVICVLFGVVVYFCGLCWSLCCCNLYCGLIVLFAFVL